MTYWAALDDAAAAALGRVLLIREHLLVVVLYVCRVVVDIADLWVCD
jgi:hypothetical protein